MPILHKIAFISALCAASASAAMAQDAGPLVGWETRFDAEAVIVLAPGLEEDANFKQEAALYELSFKARAEKTLDNGAEIGARATLRIQRDHPMRAGFSGQLDDGSGLPATRGAFSGLASGGAAKDIGARGSLETAFIYIEGGYGEVTLGRDLGVAARFHEGAPDVFTHARAADGYLDPSGLNIVRTRNDLTGPAAKISYTSPRILGVRAGVSYTPDANVRGLDRDPARAASGVVRPALKNAVEVGVQASRRLTEAKVRLRGSLTYARAEVDNPFVGAGFQAVQTSSIGAEAEWETFSIGASALSSNNGIDGSGDYSAWSIGVKTAAFGADWSANYGEASDDGAGLEGENWAIGASREMSQNLRISAGWQSESLQILQFTSASQNLNADGAVVEITLSY